MVDILYEQYQCHSRFNSRINSMVVEDTGIWLCCLYMRCEDYDDVVNVAD